MDNSTHWQDKGLHVRWSRPQNRRRNIICLSLVGIVGLSVFMIALVGPIATFSSQKLDSICKQRTFTQPYPMYEHKDFYDLGQTGDAAWSSLFTENKGYIYRQYRPEGATEDSIRVYGISMFHQLHCLQMIRSAVSSMNDTITKAVNGEPLEYHHSMGHDNHWLHCLDYLRRTTLCLADETLEPPKADTKKHGHDIVSGEGTRMCKDNSKLYEWSRMSGPSVKLRKKLVKEGKPWPELKGISEWPQPLEELE